MLRISTSCQKKDSGKISIEEQKNPKPSITFNTEFFKKDKVSINAWIIIIHEATRYEVGMIVKKKKDIERVFVVKKDLNKKDRVKSVVDKYLLGEISNNEMIRLLDVIRPKELNHKSELTGYVQGAQPSNGQVTIFLGG